MKTGQHEAFYFLFSNGAMGEGISMGEKCQRVTAVYYIEQESSAQTHLVHMFLFCIVQLPDATSL